jgi:hypothetical protein
MSKSEDFKSVEEALKALLPEAEPEPVGPAAIPVATDPWPEGHEVASDVFRRVANHLQRAAERA